MLHQIWQHIATWTEIVCGIALLYFRFCLYESEEGHLQNALVELWLRVSARSDLKRIERLLNAASQLSERFFNALFGPRLLSVRAIAISGWLLYAAVRFSLVLSYAYDTVSRRDVRDFEFEAGVILLILLTTAVLIGSFWLLTRKGHSYTWVWIAFLVCLVPLAGNVAELAGLGLAIVVDLAWLSIIRRANKWAFREGSIWRYIVVITTGTAVAGLFCFALPGQRHNGLIMTKQWLLDHASALAPMLLFQTDARLFIAVISLMQLAVMVVGLINWILWASLSRIVYAAERYQFFRERKWFGTVGVALITYAAGGHDWMKKVADVLEKAIS